MFGRTIIKDDKIWIKPSLHSWVKFLQIRNLTSPFEVAKKKSKGNAYAIPTA